MTSLEKRYWSTASPARRTRSTLPDIACRARPMASALQWTSAIIPISITPPARPEPAPGGSAPPPEHGHRHLVVERLEAHLDRQADLQRVLVHVQRPGEDTHRLPHRSVQLDDRDVVQRRIGH